MIPIEELKYITDVINAIDNCHGLIIPYPIALKMFDVADSLKLYIKQEEFD